MKCPFCSESVDDEAVVCRTCLRDISIPKPVMEANRLLESKVAALEAELADVKAQLTRHRAGAGEVVAAQLRRLGLYVLPAVVLFVIARYLLIFRFDATLFSLRIVTTVVSVAAGCLLQAHERPHWLSTASLAIVTAVGSVLGMGLLDHLTMGDSILPSDRFEWIQNSEFVGNIAFAFVVGALIEIGARPVHRAGDHRLSSFGGALAVFLAYNLPFWKDQHIDRRIRGYEKFIAFSLSALAFYGSVYTGFSRWLPTQPPPH
jgi:hypothetical protein